MEKLQKLSLSLFLILMLFSCGSETSKSLKEKQDLARVTYKAAIQFRQGSTPFQNGIAEAVSLDSTYQEAVYELSVADLKRGLPHRWLPQYNKAVKLDSAQRIPWRGYLYLWFYRDYKKAITDFDASDILTPYVDYPQGHSVDYWRGVAYLGLKDYKMSNFYLEKDIQREIEASGEDYVESTAFLYNGISYFENEQFDKALINFDKVLKYSNNSSSDAKYYKASISFKQNKIEKARKEIEAAILDFENGYYNQRGYVETLRQLYSQDFNLLKTTIN
jgi:tetratricopeptide (TPR) repeat protein